MNWFRKLKEIVATHKKLMEIVGDYDAKHRRLFDRILAAEKVIKDRTNISTDIRYHGPDRNQIIVTGRYNNADYVQLYTIDDHSLGSLVGRLKEMERYGVLDKVDAPYQMKAVFEREMKF